MASKYSSKGKGSSSNVAEKMAHGDIKVADIQTAASSTMGPRDFSKGYPPIEAPLRNSYGRKK